LRKKKIVSGSQKERGGNVFFNEGKGAWSAACKGIRTKAENWTGVEESAPGRGATPSPRLWGCPMVLGDQKKETKQRKMGGNNNLP